MDGATPPDEQSAYWCDEAHPLSLESAEGGWVVDATGRRLLDAASGHSCVNLGYAHEELIETAAHSFRRLAYCSPEQVCRPAIALAERLDRLLGGGYRVRYAATGGGANELAIDIARRYWRHRGHPGKRAVIAFDRAYHGSTGAASFASGPGILQSPEADRSPEFLHLPGPRDPAGGTTRDLADLRAGLEAAVAKAGAGTIAAMIVEPVAFAGGVVVPPAGFLELLAEFGRRNAILLIVDEVITGFGRCGAWFGFQRAAGVRPDMVTMAKGLTSAYYPLSAVAVDGPIVETFQAPGCGLDKLITMAGHPVGCDIALKVIEIMGRDGLVERVRRNAEGPLARLAALADEAGVRDVRGVGHMWGVEFGPTAEAGTVRAQSVARHCLEAGVLVLQAGNMIRINPPLVAAEAEIAAIVAAIAAAVTETHG